MLHFQLAFAILFSMLHTSSMSSCNFMSTSLQNFDGNCETESLQDFPSSSESRTVGSSCPENIQVSWLHRQPLIYQNTSKPNESDPVGVFVDLLRSSLSVCCRMNGASPPNISFDAVPARNLDELHSKVHQNSPYQSSIIMPINVDTSEKYFGMLMAVPVLQSPGDVLLLDSEKFDTEEQNKVWKSIGGVWLVVALSVLLSLVAGVCIWALVS